MSLPGRVCEEFALAFRKKFNLIYRKAHIAGIWRKMRLKKNSVLQKCSICLFFIGNLCSPRDGMTVREITLKNNFLKRLMDK